MEQSQTPYHIGNRVIAQIEKLYPYGIFVRLDDGTRGYIRRRELSWDGDIEPQHLVQIGQRIAAIVQMLPAPDRLMELSLRATLPDPWQKFITTCRVGSSIKATVKRIRPHGLYAEIEPGIDGLVPISELSNSEIDKAEDMFWVGDHIEAVVTAINSQPRGVMLSIRMRQRQLDKQFKTERSGESDKEELTTLQTDTLESPSLDIDSGLNNPSEVVQNQTLGPILVIDDEICAPMVDWLQKQGFSADAAQTPADALQKVRNQSFGLLLLDIELNGADGLSLAQQMRQAGIDVPIAVISATDRLSARSAEIEALGVVEVFAKPLDLEEIALFIDRLSQNDALPQWRSSPTPTTNINTQLLHEFTSPLHNGDPLRERLQQRLVTLIDNTHADAGIIFYLDPTSRAVSLYAHAGTTELATDAIYSLDDSPVKDVIRERTLVFEQHIMHQEQLHRRFRKLLDLLPFDACIGIPIETRSTTSHALFLFHHHHDWLQQAHLHEAVVTATLFAALIERQVFDQQMLSLGKFLLSGQLAAGFGHEIYNEMSGLEIQLRNLQMDMHLLGQPAPESSDTVEVQDVQYAVDELVKTARKLRGTAELFQGLLHAEHEETIDIHDTLRKADALLRPLRQKLGVKLRIIPNDALPPAVGSSVRLQQVLLNIMLNAIQHTSLKQNSERLIEISTILIENTNVQRIQILFRDTGPGIHKQLWERIFELGFSTRPDGTGLGLFMARSLVESLGGTIIVLHSIVPIGSTFLVELPAVPLQERVS